MQVYSILVRLSLYGDLTVSFVSVFSKELAKDNWDAIVIGSGIGGLTSAALLSKAGMKVLVLEKHGKCGGNSHERLTPKVLKSKHICLLKRQEDVTSSNLKATSSTWVFITSEVSTGRRWPRRCWNRSAMARSSGLISVCCHLLANLTELVYCFVVC